MNNITVDELCALLHSMPEPKPVFYRLYYNDMGEPVIYSMEELPGNYIEVDPETYARAPTNIQVVDKKIVYIKPVSIITKLEPGATGTPCSPHDVCVVVVETAQHVKWNKVTNEIN